MIIIRYRKFLLLILVMTGLVSASSFDLQAIEEPLKLDRLVGKRAGDFRLRDVQTDKEVWLYGLAIGNRGLGELLNIKKIHGVALVFVSPGCPVGEKYLPRLKAIADEFDDKGIKIFAIASNDADTPESLAKWARENQLNFPVLHDVRNIQADALLVERTNEVILLDNRATIRYRGAIDDQYGYTQSRPEPKNNYLKDAIRAILENQPNQITQKGTEVAGCVLTRVAPEKSKLDSLDRVRPVSEEIAEYLEKNEPSPEVGNVTYADHVAKILQEKCQACHRPDQVGGFSLLTYDDARRRSGMIAEVVDNRRMPPWHADPRYGHFSNDRRLSAKERAILLAWVEQGTPLGDPTQIPEPKKWPEGWTIGNPDVVFELPESNTVPAQGTVPYYHISVPTNLKEDVWVQAAEARPGNHGVVHHIIVYVVPPGENRGRAIGEGRGHLCGYAPGDMPSIYPEGTAKRVPAGSTLVFQMHYTPNGKQTTDRSKVGLIFSKKPPVREALTVGIANLRFQIPPGEGNFPVHSEQKFRNAVRLLAFMPHMHLRGKSFRYTLETPDGKPETLLSVPAYDFGWQSYYTLSQPLELKSGMKIVCDATFDNSERNLANPDPKAFVRWGEQTWEEMMIGYVDIDFPIQQPPVKKSDQASSQAITESGGKASE